MLETELAAKEAKIASGKLAAVKAIKRGLARWVWPAKNCPLALDFFLNATRLA